MRDAQLALLSVSNKTGLAAFARRLRTAGIDLVSTGNTARTLREADLPVRDVSDVTGFPEILDGRVKTLHPKVLGGILARRDDSAHQATVAEHDLAAFDLVCVNLYPFEETVARGESMDEVLENIDIGGPTLIRAAAKNWTSGVAVVTRPDQYDVVADEIEAHGHVTAPTLKSLAAEAFGLTSRYDAIIDQYFRRQLLDEDFPHYLNLSFEQVQELRYGENAHQRAAFYRGKPTAEPSVVNARQLHGKELSFNNIVDADTAIETVKDFERPTAVIIKHATPCGIASGDTVSEAYDLAFATDTYSPFGGIVAVNRTLDMKTAEKLGDLFLEVVIAPSFDEDALEHLKRKKNVRLLRVPGLDRRGRWGGLTYKSVVGGLVVQDRDIKEPDVDAWQVATEVKPSAEQLESMLFAFKCVRHVKSNSVVFVQGEHTVGIGAGQTARVDATRIAVWKGGERIRGSVMASDAFFPFPDAVSEAAEAGVVAIVQPGGSIRDQEVIDEANKRGLAMVFTGQRCFRH